MVIYHLPSESIHTPTVTYLMAWAPVFTQMFTLPTIVGDLLVVNGTNGTRTSSEFVTFVDIRRLVAKFHECHLPQTLGRTVH